MWPTLLIFIYCVCLILASLAGGWLPSLMRLTHTRMQLMMSLVGGLMMGVALLHLLPHSIVETNSLDYAAWSCMLGLLTMFLTIRVFNIHQHGPAPGTLEDESLGHHTHSHHDCEHPAERPDAPPHRLSWMGLFLGLAIHSVIDGVAVGASIVAAAGTDTAWRLLGAGTFFAVLFHKPLDSLSITSVMVVGQWKRRARDIVNLIFSLDLPHRRATVLFRDVRELGAGQQVAVGCALGFSAGVFLCISLADILPEIQFHYHDRVKLTVVLLAGVALSFAIGMFEPPHAHQQPSEAATPQHVHDDHEADEAE